MKTKKKKCIKYLLDGETEKPILEQLYVAHGVATDQLRREPHALFQIRDSFNHLTGHNFDADTLLRYMFNRRKASDWPKLGKSAKKIESVLNKLTAQQLAKLREIYLDLDIPSDEFLFNPERTREIADNFERLTGANIPGYVLVAVIVAKRKRGFWVRIREEAFSDITELAEKQIG